MAHSASALPSEMDVLAAVCLLLVRRPEERPTVGEVSALLGEPERLFRERWRLAGREPLAGLIAYGCSLRAAWLVHARGEKCSSATRDAGHTRPWSLNRQLLRRLGVRLCDCRGRLPEGFDWNRLCRTYLELEGGMREGVEISA